MWLLKSTCSNLGAYVSSSKSHTSIVFINKEVMKTKKQIVLQKTVNGRKSGRNNFPIYHVSMGEGSVVFGKNTNSH